MSRWRRAVEASDLPSTAKLFLLIHASSRGDGAFHDAAANIHSYKYVHIADRTSKHVRTVNRLMNQAMDAGYLRRHAGGWRGHQSEFHYTLPWEPSDCADCFTEPADERSDHESTETEWVTTTAPNTPEEMGDIVVTPSSTEGDVVTHLPSRGLQTAAWRPRGSDEGSGELPAEGLAAPDCTACMKPLHEGLWRLEPHYPTHPACENGTTALAA